MVTAAPTTSLSSAAVAFLPAAPLSNTNIEPWKLGYFLMPRSPDDKLIKLSSDADELAALALDSRTRRLVQLHLVSPNHPLSAERQAEVMASLESLKRLRLPTVPQILDIGTQQSMLHYATPLLESVPLELWRAEAHAQPIPVVCRLLFALAKDIRSLQRHQPELLGLISLNSLRVMHAGTGQTQACLGQFNLLHPTADKSFGHSAQLASGLLTLFARLISDEVAVESLVSKVEGSGATRKLAQMVADALRQPTSQAPQIELLVEALEENMGPNAIMVPWPAAAVSQSLASFSGDPESERCFQGVKSVLANYFAPDMLDRLQRFPFHAEGRELTKRGRIQLGVLPFATFLAQYAGPHQPPELQHCTPERQPNLIRPLHAWQQADLACTADDRPSGMSLTDLMSAREKLSPHESLLLLTQLAYAMRQAQILGASGIDPHPAQIWLDAEPGKDVRGMPLPWAGFSLKLRLHRTPESIFSAPLMDPNALSTALATPGQLDKEYVLRSFPALAYWLLTGDTAARPGARLSDGISPHVRAFLLDCHRAANESKAPSPPEFWINQLKAIVETEPEAHHTRNMGSTRWVQPAPQTRSGGKPKTWATISKSGPRSAWKLMA